MGEGVSFPVFHMQRKSLTILLQVQLKWGRKGRQRLLGAYGFCGIFKTAEEETVKSDVTKEICLFLYKNLPCNYLKLVYLYTCDIKLYTSD